MSTEPPSDRSDGSDEPRRAAGASEYDDDPYDPDLDRVLEPAADAGRADGAGRRTNLRRVIIGIVGLVLGAILLNGGLNLLSQPPDSAPTPSAPRPRASGPAGSATAGTTTGTSAGTTPAPGAASSPAPVPPGATSGTSTSPPRSVPS